MKLFDLRQPFFLPLWRRVATLAVAGGWAVVELVSGSPGWAALFAALAIYCAYEFFVAFNPDDYKDPTDD
ncbi:hypothetical protein [Puniceibacterium sp. IMCC21224]|uniref:hypothetical protein n=1 Tax=Puniceibacterium sp. IMCC21224 TaxID=1618204 RepID=UPI00064DEE2A|nr:hypothetical protein [Puniceibacterium sp. IMCC21224]KMK69000.1 hypothetical protein IMCC21224_113888 [Puniceibacterium sp. IMCC21224]